MLPPADLDGFRPPPGLSLIAARDNVFGGGVGSVGGLSNRASSTASSICSLLELGDDVGHEQQQQQQQQQLQDALQEEQQLPDDVVSRLLPPPGLGDDDQGGDDAPPPLPMPTSLSHPFPVLPPPKTPPKVSMRSKHTKHASFFCQWDNMGDVV